MTAIRSYRIAAGLTQAQLADSLGVTQAAVAMWEAGDRKPDIVMLKRIAQTLHTSTDSLLETLDEPATETEKEDA